MKLVHIAQTHAYLAANHSPTVADFDEVVQSQIAVAQLILQNPNCSIVCESARENRTFQECSQGKFFYDGPTKTSVEQMKRVFPRGLPNNFNDLNLEQKTALYSFGATTVLLLLTLIPVIYKSIDSDTADVAWHFLNNDLRIAFESKIETDSFRTKVLDLQSRREKAAIQAVKDAAEAHYKTVDDKSIVILVYGALHDFQALCTNNGWEYEKVYTHSGQLQRHNEDSASLSLYTPGSQYWRSSEICDSSTLDFNKTRKQSPSQCSPSSFFAERRPYINPRPNTFWQEQVKPKMQSAISRMLCCKKIESASTDYESAAYDYANALD